MAITYVTDGDWGTGTGTPNTASKVDENFWTLWQAIQDAVSSAPQPVEISNFEVNGSQLMVYMSNGSSFGPFTLPTATFQFRGDYVPGETFYELDIITVPSDGLYMVRLDHIAAASFNPDAVDGDGNALYELLFKLQPAIYDIGLFYPGMPGNGLDSDGYIAAHLFLRNVYLPSDLNNSRARLRVAPEADLTFPIARLDTDGGVDETIGSVLFAAGVKEGVFTLADDENFADGETLVLLVPSVLDTTARDLTITFSGVLGVAA
jgi:hypothetical protein